MFFYPLFKIFLGRFLFILHSSHILGYLPFISFIFYHLVRNLSRWTGEPSGLAKLPKHFSFILLSCIILSFGANMTLFNELSTVATSNKIVYLYRFTFIFQRKITELLIISINTNKGSHGRVVGLTLRSSPSSGETLVTNV